MLRFLVYLLVLANAIAFLPQARCATQKQKGHYLFVWAGDAAGKNTDFLAVINADPHSPDYGKLVTVLSTKQRTVQNHHTEYVMPKGGMLFASDYGAGRTFLFDLRDPLHPKVARTFLAVDGYTNPHSYVRLPNGDVLASFQYNSNPNTVIAHHSGALVELDPKGNFVRAVSTDDPAYPHALLIPYSLVVLPKIDRAVSTNSVMSDYDANGDTYQVWRLSDLKLLHTLRFDPGANFYGNQNPEEPRQAADGSVMVQTFSCGLQRITDIASEHPRAKLVYTFPGGGCGVPTIVGHYLLQSVPLIHGIVVLNIADPAKPVEVSRVSLGNDYRPHWTGWDAATNRVIVTPGLSSPSHRVFLLKFDPATGAIAIDRTFHDVDGKPGFAFNNRTWPQGRIEIGSPHGAVFSR